MTKYKKDYFFMGNSNHNYLGIPEKENKYEIDTYDINNKNDSHSIIYNLISNNSSILDVGCSTGILGKMIKENKSCKVDGIEYDQCAYDILKKKKIYDNLYNFSITDQNSSNYQNFIKNHNKYDYIVFADVLEHIVNPLEVINAFSYKLNNNGKLIISIPNIGHIDIIKGLLNQDFNYNDIGILDNTHLRFFTSNSFFEMMENYNEVYDRYLSVNYVDCTTYQPSYISGKNLFNQQKFFIVQNIFELTLADSKEKIYYNNKPTYSDNFKKIVEIFEEFNYQKTIIQENKNTIKNYQKNIGNLEIENMNLKEQIDTLNKQIETFMQQFTNKSEELEKIINSKSWKYVTTARNLYNKIKGVK